MKNSHLESKRRFLTGLASSGIAATGLLIERSAHASTIPPFEVRPAPKYYPKPSYVPDITLAGKVAVITGASRGIGLAVGLALQALDVQVIGTSRTPDAYPDHPFPLLTLNLADPVSIQAFVPAVLDLTQVKSIGGVAIF